MLIHSNILKRFKCFLTISLIYLIIILLNNLTSSNSINFSSSKGMDIKENLNYGIIIDAGSTGSRLFLYEWISKSDKQLIDIKIVNDLEGKPVVKKVTPGLSSFAEKPDAAPDYLLPLLQYASERIPTHKRPKTPLFIFATAGMRLLPLEKQNLIISSLRKKLPKIIELKINPENIKVITGKWEGIYSWIAVNYMLGRFNSTTNSLSMNTQIGNNDNNFKILERQKTAGMIDMGGASTQIAFELPLNLNEQQSKEEDENENIQIIQLISSTKQFLFKIFVTTFLGFGVNEGAKKYEKLLWSKINNGRNSSEKEIILDGCLPKDFLKLTSIEDEDGQQFVRKGDGQWDNCVQDIATLIFDKHKECPKTKKCFFGGVKIPKGVSLSDFELYGFSEYWFSVDDVLSLGGIYDHDIFEEKAKQFCRQTWREIKKKVRAKQYPKADRDRIETQCFKSAWIHAILHNGFYVEEKRNHFQSAFKIKGQEVQWALGAMIYQMRDFPVKASGSMELRSSIQLSNYTWIILYLFSFIIVVAFIWKTYQIRKKQLNGNSRLYRYRRLDRQLTQNMA
uniref:Uncharacterized protein n=1 Tax=Meloidogyne enterolobii TaxID=390850 RepID=A0A6V7TIN3_MELEN|nr:unnamed protein product [Meloidogyne enterolobii]